MFCKKCGNEINDNVTFCKFCGEKINKAHDSLNEENEIRENEQGSKETRKISYKHMSIIILITTIVFLALFGFYKKFVSNNSFNDTTKQKEENGKDLYYITISDYSFPVYYTYNLFESSYSGPFDLQGIKKIKSDYYIKINEPEGNFGISSIELFDKNFDKVSMLNSESCMGSYFNVNNKLYIDNGVDIGKIDFTDTPTCTIIGDSDINSISVKIIHLDDLQNNNTYDVSGYRYYYLANPGLNARYDVSNAEKAMKKIPDEQVREIEFFDVNTYKNAGKIFVRNGEK